MEAIVKNWEIYSLIWVSDKEWELELVIQNNDEVITDYIISNEQKKLISYWAEFIYNWWIVIINSIQAEKNILDEEKRIDIFKYKEIEKEAISKRSEYLAAELLPVSPFRDMKLTKLEADRIDIENKYNEAITNLVTKYWETILTELL